MMTDRLPQSRRGRTAPCQQAWSVTRFSRVAVLPQRGWVYDEDEQGTKWEDLPDDFTCELCGVGKDDFTAEA